MAVDPGGYDVPKYEDRRADDVVPEWQSRFGAGSNTASSTDDGNIIDQLTAFLQAVDERGSFAYNSGFFNTATGLNLDALIGGLFGSQRAPDRGSTTTAIVYGEVDTVVSPAADPSQVSTSIGDVYSVSGPVTIEFSDIAVFVFGPSTDGSVPTITIQSDTYTTTIPIIGTGLQVAEGMWSVLPTSDANIVSKNDPFEDPFGNGIIVLNLTGLLNASVETTGSESATFRGVETPVTSEEAGPIPGLAYEITTINSPIDGWEGVVNLDGVSPGALEDTDAQYRQRHLDTLGKGGTSTLIALKSILLDITLNPGVEYVEIYNNPKSSTDSAGRPGHSFEVVIEGGEELTIVTLIWENHPLGIETFGSTSVLISDTRAAGTHEIKYTRPTKRFVWSDVTITAGEGFPSEQISDIQESVAQSLTDFGQTLGVGRDIYIDELKQQIEVPGTQSVMILLGTASSATAPKPPVSAANVTVSDTELTVWDVSKISVTVIQ